MTETMDAADFAAMQAGQKRGNKYHAVKHTEDGHVFASGAELRRYRELRLMADQGLITDLDIHPKFKIVVNGVHICRYTADFAFVDEQGRNVVEDVKSEPTKTRDYKLRKKLMLAVFGVEITEVAA